MIDEIGESCEDEKTLNECCISCKMGSMTSSEKCSQLVNLIPSIEAQNSFIECCLGEDSKQTMTDDRCPQGFIFNQPLQVCDDIDECYQELDDCLNGMETCTNTLGSYNCEPITGSANNSINSCPSGRRKGGES